MSWTLKPCFRGGSCWCRILVDPQGEECSNYGDIGLECARFIIDALNRTPGKEYAEPPEMFPIPWTTEKIPRGDGFELFVVTERRTDLGPRDGLVTMSVSNENAELIVQAVNNFYRKDVSIESDRVSP